MQQRLGPVDAARAIACVLIVWHHLAYYGPMSDVAWPLAPALFSWLWAHARMAVQVFLVVSGFLLARSLRPQRAQEAWPTLVGRRYLRLVTPYAAALVLSILVADGVRAWGTHPAVPAQPHWSQLLAHLLMLQDLRGEEALSAGVWYVAIDLQLFALATGLWALAGRRGSRWAMGAVAVLTAASLLWFNRDRRLDVTALYFFGAYGMGLLAGWAARSERPWAGLAAIGALGAAALLLDWRGRIAVALATALALGALQAAGAMAWQPPRWVAWLARISYPVFLAHFAVLLAVGALWGRLWPAQPVVNALGMALAFGLSLLLGAALHRLEQGLLRPRRALGWQMAVLAAGLVAIGL